VNESFASLRAPGTDEALEKKGVKLVSASGQSFPIVQDIPRFVGSDNYASDFGRQWNRFRVTQLDSHTGKPLTRDRLDRCFRGQLADVAGKRVLEAGSGAGRFTEVLLGCGANLDSFDYSNAVEANAVNNGAHPFTLVQADIRAMPFERGAYDYVVCLGVIQHTPDSEESIAKLWAMVKPGGALVIDHYRWSRTQLPPPIGGARSMWRRIFLTLPQDRRWPAVKRLVDTFFPLYWRYRDNKWARRALDRIAGINFYYPDLPLGSREAFYQ
jgi:SAM-dependent methyltransferase